METVAEALRRPARPLFVGRKTCLPSTPILLGVREAQDVFAALKAEPAHPRAGKATVPMNACWPSGLGGEDVEVIQHRLRTDDRDWRQQIPVGLHRMTEGVIRGIPPCT